MYNKDNAIVLWHHINLKTFLIIFLTDRKCISLQLHFCINSKMIFFLRFFALSSSFANILVILGIQEFSAFERKFTFPSRQTCSSPARASEIMRMSPVAYLCEWRFGCAFDMNSTFMQKLGFYCEWQTNDCRIYINMNSLFIQRLICNTFSRISCLFDSAGINYNVQYSTFPTCGNGIYAYQSDRTSWVLWWCNPSLLFVH